MELCNFVYSIRVMMKILFVKGGAMMGNLRQRIEKMEGAIKARQLQSASAPEWAVRCISAEQEFQKILNGMKVRYCGGEPTPLLTQDEILQKAGELAIKYGSEKAYQQACLEYERRPEGQKTLEEKRRRYGLT